jgi:hypothetical protein
MSKSGREFEEAVWAFVQTLDPSAEVLFNHIVPDRDTGTPRQCDVWINARFGGHWPISILASCKDHKRKLDVGDIGTFCGEVRSTGASTGVMYSKSGFTKPALKKAKANGLSCCRLYQNEPADIPAAVWFESFACAPRIGLTLQTPTIDSELKNWNDIFNIGFVDSSRTVVDKIVEVFHKVENEAVEEAKGMGQFPKEWLVDIEFSSTHPPEEKLGLHMHCIWKKYKGRVEASLINGSYCLSNGSFHGSQSMPWIDIRSEHPGDNWIEITDQEIELPTNWIITILYHGDLAQALREQLGPRLINS